MSYGPKQHFTKIRTSRRRRIVSRGRPVNKRDMVKLIFAFRNMLKALKNDQWSSKYAKKIPKYYISQKLQHRFFEYVPIS